MIKVIKRDNSVCLESTDNRVHAHVWKCGHLTAHGTVDNGKMERRKNNISKCVHKD